MELRKLEWYDEPGRLFDGKSNGSMAVDDVYPKNAPIRIYIRYDVRRGASEATDNQWHIFIHFPSESKHEQVESLEAGKTICEHYRRLFWEEFYKTLTKSMFKKEV